MATAFNLKDGQKAERKQLLTVVEWTPDEGTEAAREILGIRTEESSIEYNPDIKQSKDILGYNYADVESTQPQQDFDPFYILGGSKLGMYLNSKRRRNALSELSSFTVYIITAFAGKTGAYEAEMHENCTIMYNSIGGDTSVNMPISVYYSNQLTPGTVDKLSPDFEFTPSVEV